MDLFRDIMNTCISSLFLHAKYVGNIDNRNMLQKSFSATVSDRGL